MRSSRPEVRDQIVTVDRQEAEGTAPGVRLPAPDRVDALDEGNDVAGSFEVPVAELVLLGALVVLRPRPAVGTAELVGGAVDAVAAGERRREDEADLERRATPELQELRVDVRRVREEVGPQRLACLAAVQILEIALQLVFRVAPREIGVMVLPPGEIAW
jgi:hypothetical protein